jgi:transcriptional regulator with XRE-family HTH domain
MNDVLGVPSGAEETVGPFLAQMRKAQRLTGAALAKRVQMSQSKISRLENGVGFPDPSDVAKVAAALGASDDEIRHLVDLAEHAHNRMTDWRPFPAPLAHRQQFIADWEASARVFRVFQPAAIVGLLQTSEYARAILTSFQELEAADTESDDTALSSAVLEAVSARVKRQEVLGDRNRTFYFLMVETVLTNRVCPPEHMPAQIQRLREATRLENVRLGIIPADARWSIPPFHGFVLLDEDAVSVDLFNTGIFSRGKADARLYRKVFERCAAIATTDVDEILDRHLARYLDLSKPKTSH